MGSNLRKGERVSPMGSNVRKDVAVRGYRHAQAVRAAVPVVSEEEYHCDCSEWCLARSTSSSLGVHRRYEDAMIPFVTLKDEVFEPQLMELGDA